METVCAIMILAPILFPVVTALGVDPIHFGIIMVTNLAIGFITPPLGVNLFVASRVGETTLDVVIRGIVPFLVLMIATLMLITYVPAISKMCIRDRERDTRTLCAPETKSKTTEKPKKAGFRRLLPGGGAAAVGFAFPVNRYGVFPFWKIRRIFSILQSHKSHDLLYLCPDVYKRQL